MRGDLGREPVLQRRQPGHLVGELLGARCLAVGEIAAHDAHVAEGAGDHARLFVGVAGDVAHDVGGRQLGDQRDAVVGLLPEELHVPAGVLQLGVRKLRVDELGLLQHDRIGLHLGQPGQQVGQADGEGVDVPGGEFHGERRE